MGSLFNWLLDNDRSLELIDVFRSLPLKALAVDVYPRYSSPAYPLPPAPPHFPLFHHSIPPTALP